MSADQPVRVTYLDHAASSPLRPEVAEALAPFTTGYFANPSGSHRLARQARQALEEARDEVAQLLGCRPGEVVFTSSGTESVNLALLGVLAARHAARRPGGTVVRSAVEHPAVIETCDAARARGDADGVRVAPVDAHGAVDLDALAGVLEHVAAQGAEVSLVSVMTANNEVGTIEPLDAVGHLVRRLAPVAWLHSDAVQAAAALDLADVAAGADLVSISAHKLGGPKGVGALVVRDGVPLAPIIHGGGQERERRSGTNDVAGAVALAAALRACAAGRATETARLAALRNRLADGLAAVPGLRETVPRQRTLPGHLHVTVAGVEREELLVLLDRAGLCASAGASCASGALEASHVLAAMGVEEDRARGALRLSLGHTTTEADVDRALAVVPDAVARLRAADPVPT